MRKIRVSMTVGAESHRAPPLQQNAVGGQAARRVGSGGGQLNTGVLNFATEQSE